ncbi:unnamed protein product [Phytomonas sp. Hart1]|nr:unnamed protein product [Phytomonas sp. Hart1]|eukprot:CCW66552.1 unnamed protein product [Phytomonas sp. isolate Hart1]
MAAMKDCLFYVGLLILAHAIYAAMGRRGQLQAWHHSRTWGPLPGLVFFLIGAEALLGMLLAMVGFVYRSPLKEARLAELTQYYRYDRNMHTGVGFIHFNHRGTLGAARKPAEDGRASETSLLDTEGGGETELAKKND